MSRGEPSSRSRRIAASSRSSFMGLTASDDAGGSRAARAISLSSISAAIAAGSRSSRRHRNGRCGVASMIWPTIGTSTETTR
jgi:hypothetical protein